MELKECIKKYKKEMITNLSKLVSYRSVLGEESENAPYGIECAKCLQEALKIAESYGFKTKNLDNKCGYAEIGEGEEIVGILTHLDVVPEGNGWDTEPFEATTKDNKIYGRGTSDDKGAAIASMVALKIIKDLDIPLNKRVRLIMGCKEETGSECMKHYVEKEGNITIGFTPDGDFPLVHGEKGQVRVQFTSRNINGLEINGGVVENAVSDYCEIKIRKCLYKEEIFSKYLKNNNIECEITNIDDEFDLIQVKGESAHASTPELGKNAISYAIMGLKEAEYEDYLTDFYCQYIKLETDGTSMGIKCEDEFGKLTLVNGKIQTNGDEITGTIDIRVPVRINSDEIVNKLIKKSYDGAKINVKRCSNSLYYSLNSKIVKSLMKAYIKVTGDNESKPITMGGGTYAKTMKNCVAFGCKFPGTDNRIHNANEFVVIDELLLQVELYVNAILELIKDDD